MMSATIPANLSLPLQEHVYLPGVSYATYEALIQEIEDRRRLRITYHRGQMEIMSPSQDHERTKRLIGRMIEAMTEELNIPILSVGSTTFKDDLKECGLEPDECYYVQNEAHVRGRAIDLGTDPPPDLVLEVDISTNVVDRLPIYAALRFPEVWQFVAGDIVIHALDEKGGYNVSEKSRALPMAPVKQLVKHLKRCEQTDETTWIRSFREWVRQAMK